MSLCRPLYCLVRRGRLARCAAAWLALAAGLSLASAPAAAAPSAPSAAAAIGTGTGTGTAVPIGGGLADDNHAVWNRLVAAAGGKGARFAVFGTASGEPEASARAAAANLRRHGAQTDIIPVSPLLKGRDVAAAVRDPALVARVARARGVFFTGGDQARITAALQPGGQRSPLLAAVWGVHQRGGVVAGTSAGAAIMSDPMFRDAPEPLTVLQGRLRVGEEVDRGLGFAGPGVFVDQHFFARGRLARLLPALVATSTRMGIGVEENTALFFHGDDIEVVGAHGAILVDLRDVDGLAPAPGPFEPARLAGGLRVSNVRVSLLAAGDRVQRGTWQVVPAPARLHGTAVVPGDGRYQPENAHAGFVIDLLAPQAFPRAIERLIDSADDELRGLAFRPLPAADDPQPGQGFEFRLVKDARTRGWSAEVDDADTWTVSNVRLDVQPVRMAQPFFTPWVTPGVTPGVTPAGAR